VLHVIALGRSFNDCVPFTESPPAEVDEVRSFQIRMDIHDHSNAFVLRFRSIWDKVMGILVLRYEPDRYESFYTAKSKKAAFRKIFKSHQVIPEEFVQRAEEIIESFDNRLRTPEAHGTGILRKSSFTWLNLHDSPPLQLLGYWNFFNEVAHLVGAMFDEDIAKGRIAESKAEAF
jgi:hypothetical protein